MLSDRTAKYFEALIREGPNFNYLAWFRRVQEEEAQQKQISNELPQAKSAAAEITNPIITPDCHDVPPNSTAAVTSKPLPRPRAEYLSENEASEIRVRRRLERVRDAWKAFQASRARDAVYGYLVAVFAIVERYKGRRKTKKLLRHVCKVTGLPVDENADPFATVIRCTSDHVVDNKTISKWARALRYVAYCQVPRTQLKTFMKETGGVNACAERYARCGGRTKNNVAKVIGSRRRRPNASKNLDSSP